MSDNQAKAVKYFSILGGVLGAAVSLTMAFAGTEESTARVLWIMLAVVFLILIYPLYQAAKTREMLASHEERLRILARSQSKMSKNTPDPISRYSPLVKSTPVRGKANTLSNSVPNEAESTFQYDPVPESGRHPLPKQPTGDLTREFSQKEKHLNEETGEFSIEEVQKGKGPHAQGSIMSVGKNTFGVNRGMMAITRFSPAVSVNPISAGGLHTVAIRRDGYAVATGYGTYGQCNVTGWRDMVSVSAGNHHTVGLRSDGTCIACGYVDNGQCDVSEWKNICAIATGASHSVGLLTNGTCVAVGDNTYGQCNVFDWTEIIAVVASSNYTVGLRVDGTIVAVGANTDGKWGAIQWGGISAVAAGGLHTVGLRSDGTCVSVGNNANNQCEVSRWHNITAIAAGNFHTVGLKEDGHVIAVGHNGYGQCDVSGWSNIVAISAGRNHTVALDRSGRVYATGDNTYGQCTVSDFTDIKTLGVK